MQAGRLQFLPAAAVAVLALLSRPAAAVLSRRRCYCDLRLGRLVFSPLLLEVPDPVLSGFLVSCRRARQWCPDACRRAARNVLIKGGPGEVSPLTGSAGATACEAAGRAVSASQTPVHLYATYRVSNCRHSGSHYFGRLCCQERTHTDGRKFFWFNEACHCEKQTSIQHEKNGTTNSMSGDIAAPAPTHYSAPAVESRSSNMEDPQEPSLESGTGEEKLGQPTSETGDTTGTSEQPISQSGTVSTAIKQAVSESDAASNKLEQPSSGSPAAVTKLQQSPESGASTSKPERSATSDTSIATPQQSTSESATGGEQSQPPTQPSKTTTPQQSTSETPAAGEPLAVSDLVEDQRQPEVTDLAPAEQPPHEDPGRTQTLV